MNDVPTVFPSRRVSRRRPNHYRRRDSSLRPFVDVISVLAWLLAGVTFAAWVYTLVSVYLESAMIEDLDNRTMSYIHASMMAWSLACWWGIVIMTFIAVASRWFSVHWHLRTEIVD